MSHTPGPWQYGGSLISAGNVHVARTLYRMPDRLPTNDHSDCAPESFRESDANRLLMAAAPELLEACRMAEKVLAKYPIGDPLISDVHTAAKRIRAAISKAEGNA